MAKRKRKQTKATQAKEPGSSDENSTNDGSNEADSNSPNVSSDPSLQGKVTPRRTAFRISLGLSITWLVVLAYLAYIVVTVER